MVDQFREGGLVRLLGVSGRTSEQRRELTSRLLDGIRVGQVARQNLELTADRLDELPSARRLVRAEGYP